MRKFNGKMLVASAVIVLGVLGTLQNEAPAQTPISFAALCTAASGFSPLPTPKLYSANVMERVEQMAADDQWPMPDEIKPWPLDEYGTPLISTRQVDELWQTLRERETSRHRLRQMFRGDMKKIQKLNPNLDFGSLSAGDEVLVWQRNSDEVSQSLGYANQGRLRDSEPMPPGDNYVVLHPHRSFGTYYSVSEITRVMDAYKVRFPEADPVMIGDLSFRTGRRIQPHKSHQSGRDVDITFPRKNHPPNYRWFHPITRRTLDVPKSLWMLKSFIAGGQIEYVFVDRQFQYLLAREAKKQGAPREWIRRVFQYPHTSGTRAVIRHARGHRDHFHIRFKCQETDKNCL
jgi:murein endopeptidase